MGDLSLEEAKVLNQEKWGAWQRNVQDKYKDIPTEDIKKDLQERAFPAAILMSQIEGDFNIGSVIRSANNFNLSKIYYYGRKRFDRRSTCGTHHYTDVVYSTLDDLPALKSQYKFVALDNNINKSVQLITNYTWQSNSLIVVGEENAGIQQEVLDMCDDFIEIPSLGSVRSLNVASAASIAMFHYISQIAIK